jgi:hypothetical protein
MNLPIDPVRKPTGSLLVKNSERLKPHPRMPKKLKTAGDAALVFRNYWYQ